MELVNLVTVREERTQEGGNLLWQVSSLSRRCLGPRCAGADRGEKNSTERQTLPRQALCSGGEMVWAPGGCTAARAVGPRRLPPTAVFESCSFRLGLVRLAEECHVAVRCTAGHGHACPRWVQAGIPQHSVPAGALKPVYTHPVIRGVAIPSPRELPGSPESPEPQRAAWRSLCDHGLPSAQEGHPVPVGHRLRWDVQEVGAPRCPVLSHVRSPPAPAAFGGRWGWV